MTLPNFALLSATTPAAGGAAATVEFLQTDSRGTDASSYTFTGNFGAADADRTIVVVFGGRRASTFSISSVSIGGVSATNVVTASSNVLATNLCAIYAAAVPSGTSGDVVVTLSATILRCAIAVYRCTGITVTPNGTNSASVNGVSTALSTSVTATDNGAVIAGVFNGASGTTFTWSAVTEDYEAQTAAESGRLGGASDEFASPGAVSVSVTPSADWGDGVAVAAAW